MLERSALVIDTLLVLHHQQDAAGVLGTLSRLTPECGRAVAWCYLFDPAADVFRLVQPEEAHDGSPRRLWQADARLPHTLPGAALAPALTRMAGSGVPVSIVDRLPDFLIQAWGAERSAEIRQALPVTHCAVAPVCTAQGPVGVLVLVTQSQWPVQIAAECAAHAAAALAQVAARRPAPTSEVDPHTGLSTASAVEQAAARELERAARYRHALSVVVIDLHDAEQPAERLAAAAALVARAMRGPDIAGCLGHNRIVVLLPETPSGGAAAFRHRLRGLALSQAGALQQASATFPQDGRTLDELVHAAVARLGAPEPLPVPGSAVRGSLRAAFPTFGRLRAVEGSHAG